MSRIEYVDADSQEQWLRMCAFEANTERHLKGKKGQAVLRELEAALLALPEKKLLEGTFIVTPDADNPQGGVCAMGCLLLKRKMDKGLTRQEALREIDEEAPTDVLDEDYGGWEVIKQTAQYMNCKINFVWEVVEQNDEFGGRTPEQRYARVLEWVRSQILPTPERVRKA